jgi:Protein of unknown function (DUF4232)
VSSGAGSSRAGWVTAALVCCLTAVAGCGSSSSPTSSAPATSASPAGTATAPAAGTTTVTVTATPSSATGTPGLPSCATSVLKVKQGLAQGYAGGVYQVIDFTNTSGTSCTLYGYPGVSFVTAPPYSQIGLAAKRVPTSPVKLITLAPGATANSLLQIVDALNFTPSTCNPVKAAYLRIYPPNQTAAVYLPNTSETCSKPVQTLFVSAVAAGSGGSS